MRVSRLFLLPLCRKSTRHEKRVSGGEARTNRKTAHFREGGLREKGGVLTASLLRLHLGGIVLRATLEKVLTALGVLDVLNPDVDALPSDAPTDLLVHLDTHSTRSHVPDDARATLVRKVGHALLLRRVHLDVDVVPNL